MTPEEDVTWEALCLQYPNALPFRNCGWEIYEDVKKLCPNKAKGTHSFYPSNGTQGTRDPTTTEASQGGEESSTLHQFSPEWDETALNTAFQESQSDDEVPSNSIDTEAGDDSPHCNSPLPPIGDTSSGDDGMQVDLTKVTSYHTWHTT
ncbi:hypothetical protein BGW80DRAFT_1248677 [Lactifluus volemus]|nr:hypothetical protein BGW80DRAFT_1248677 [Lactifluus volemus]